MGIFRRQRTEKVPSLSPEVVRELAENFLARAALEAAEIEVTPSRINGLVEMPEKSGRRQKLVFYAYTNDPPLKL